MLVAARSESGRANATPHGLPQQPNDPISRFPSVGDGQQDEHSAWIGPASKAMARNASPANREARTPSISVDNLVSPQRIPRFTREAYAYRRTLA